MRYRYGWTLLGWSVLVACASEQAVQPVGDYVETPATPVLEAPPAVPGRYAPADRHKVARGEYLVALLACGACHTDGALIGEPKPDRALAGSRVGIAYINPLGNDRPGVVFPPNITPDVETGIGAWSDMQIADAIRAGAGRHVDRRIVMMPWAGYARLSEDDVSAVVLYLRSIESVKHRVPDAVVPGTETEELFVYFGVYRSR